MPKIEAFVGHSFTNEDKVLNQKFLDYFTEIRNLYPDLFGWEHAFDASPDDVGEKVLRMLEGKNTFIGICTKKERVISPDKLRLSGIFSNKLSAKEDAFEWKTSDWVIQEIGLATGRNLKTILLVESGFRPPGGIQGNLEYIEFERANPEASFTRLMQMLVAIAPKEVGGNLVAPITNPKSKEPKLSTNEIGNALIVLPKPDWGRDDYDSALIDCMIKKDDVGAKSLSDAYLKTDLSLDGQERLEWKAQFEFLNILFFGKGQISVLKELSEANPDNKVIKEFYARGLSHYGENSKAASLIEQVASLTTDDNGRMNSLLEAIRLHIDDSDIQKAKHLISGMRTIFNSNGRGELTILSALKRVADKEKDEQTIAAALERISELTPGDTDNLFSAAFKHSEIGNDDLALMHYLRIPLEQRSSSTWNNLGVQFSDISAKGRSVAAYQKAKTMGETLAMANLANIYLSVGLYSEAKAECQEAQMNIDYHQNVNNALTRLNEVPDAEQKLIDQAIGRAKPVSDFYRKFGNAMTLPEIPNSTAQWQGPDCVLDVKIFQSSFIAVGTYEEPVSGLGVILNSGSDVKREWKVAYTGTFIGQSLHGKVTRKSDTPSYSLLNANDSPSSFMLIIDDTGKVMSLLERPATKLYRFSSIKKIDGA